MVDLVKIRKKAKEKKEAEQAAEIAQEQSAREMSAAAAGDVPKVAAEAEERVDPAPVVETPSPSVPQPKRTASASAPVAPAAPEPARLSTATNPPAATQAPEVLPEKSGAMPAKTNSTPKLDHFKATAGQRVSQADLKSETEGLELLQELEVLTFRLADESYAIEIEKIVEIVSPRATTRVPNAHENIVGIMSLRGTIVTVLDLRRKLGHPAAPDETADTRLVVVEHEGETAGFVVDRVSRVMKLDPAKLESPPVVNASEQNDYIRGVFQQGTTLTILLDLDRILSR